MQYKVLGAIMIILGCGGYGFRLAIRYKNQEKMFYQIIRIIDVIQSELQYRLTPLPLICQLVTKESSGCIKLIFRRLQEELYKKVSTDVSSCMQQVIFECKVPSGTIREILLLVANALDRFDMSGQIRGLEFARSSCIRYVDEIAKNKDEKTKCYKVLGFCTGIALAIVLI